MAGIGRGDGPIKEDEAFQRSRTLKVLITISQRINRPARPGPGLFRRAKSPRPRAAARPLCRVPVVRPRRSALDDAQPGVEQDPCRHGASEARVSEAARGRPKRRGAPISPRGRGALM